MKVKRIVPTGLLGLIVAACNVACAGGGKSGSDTLPTAPTATVAPAPAGCSGGTVDHVKVSFTVGGGGSINLQMFGETFSQPVPSGQSVEVDRALVPCDYEIIGQMQNRALEIGFSRGSGISTADTGGVQRGSIVVDQGPNPTFSSSTSPCKVQFIALPESGLNPPLPIKIRFRVSTTNGLGILGNQNGGCS